MSKCSVGQLTSLFQLLWRVTGKDVEIMIDN